MVKTCADYNSVTSDTITDSACSGYNSSCTANRAADACITRVATCATAVDASCTYADDGACTWEGSCTLTSPGTPAAPTCAEKFGTHMTYSTCTTHLSSCSVNLVGS